MKKSDVAFAFFAQCICFGCMCTMQQSLAWSAAVRGDVDKILHMSGINDTLKQNLIAL